MKIRKLFSIGLLLSIIALTVFNVSVTQAITQDDINSIRGFTPFFDPNASQCSNSSTGSTGATSVDVTGSNVKIAYAYLTANGFSAAQAAGIVGNLVEESAGVNPTQWQDGGGGGYGIAQWTPPTSMIAWVSAKGGNPNSLGGTTGKIGQLDYLLYDLKNSDPQTYKQVQSDPSVVAATTDFMNGYERPNQAYAALSTRISDAQAVYQQYGGSTTTAGSSTTTDEGNCSSAGGPVNAQGCSNPWAQDKNLSPERIDMGVDYNAPGGSPILAICPGTVSGVATGGTGWDSPENTQACVAVNITSGAYSGKSYYVCEDIVPTVKVGDKVQAGQEIATFKTSPTGLETGWAVPNGLWSPLAANLNQECMNGDPGCWSAAAGVSFNKLIVATGGKSGIFVPGAPKQTMPPGYP